MTGVQTLGDIDPYDRTRIALTMGQAGYISESYWVSTIDPFVKKKKKKKSHITHKQLGRHEILIKIFPLCHHHPL